MEAILFIGIQATGKSEFYKRNFYKTHMRINLDMLRTRRREEIFLQACIQAKQPFVVDNTNVTREGRERYIALAKGAGFGVTGYYFSSSVQAAIARNQNRQGKERVALPAILGTHKKLELPLAEEGFGALYYVRIAPGGEFTVEDYRYEV